MTHQSTFIRRDCVDGDACKSLYCQNDHPRQYERCFLCVTCNTIGNHHLMATADDDFWSCDSCHTAQLERAKKDPFLAQLLGMSGVVTEVKPSVK
jgi:hypothetical protein